MTEADKAKEVQQRKDFRYILYDLAKNQELLANSSERRDIYKRLEALYHSSNPKNRFRHFYSDIFSVLARIKNDPKLGNIDMLGQNLDYIRRNYMSKNKDAFGNDINISDSLRKLYDHVSLDIARMNYSDEGDRKLSGEAEITDLKTKFNLIKVDVETTKQAQVENEEKIKDQQKEYIAILGIFSGVVIAFIAEIAFSTSVLNNMKGTGIYRIVIVSLLIGFVAVNVIFGLFYYIDRLVNKKPSLKPLIVSNIAFATLMATTFIFWCCGTVENRNQRINNKVPTTSQIVETITETTLLDDCCKVEIYNETDFSDNDETTIFTTDLAPSNKQVPS